MSLSGFDELFEKADSRKQPVTVATVGGDDPTVLEALRAACDRGWVAPIVVGSETATRDEAARLRLDLQDFRIVPVELDVMARAAVAEVREGRARLLMKGRVSTPLLLRAVFDPAWGLRTGRVICQVVLMEILRDARRFLLADPGISAQPSVRKRIDILKSVVEVAHCLGAELPRVALLAASESVNSAMPETLVAAELEHRNQQGEFPDCLIQGPLSFDLAYAADAGVKKRVGGAVVGAADAMVFPNLLAANLTVKAIMYTADCRFGGVLRGTSSPVVFMSRADSTATRLNSLALSMALLEG